nr:MAG TPA: hypothetical protein [Caudoviricetes sp.]
MLVVWLLFLVTIPINKEIKSYIDNLLLSNHLIATLRGSYFFITREVIK